MKGKFIVLEGLDGSGKSTQIKLLKQYFEQTKGYTVQSMHFPRTDEESPVFGPMIGSFLRGEYGRLEQVHPQLVSLLYAGDRWNAAVDIREHLQNGHIVLCDRYVLSNVAFQCAKIDDEQERQRLLQFIFYMEFQFFSIPRPDISFFLHVPIDFVAKQLSVERGGETRAYLRGKQDIHEANINFQKRVEQMYLMLCHQFPEQLFYISCMEKNNQMKTPEQITELIVRNLEERGLK